MNYEKGEDLKVVNRPERERRFEDGSEGRSLEAKERWSGSSSSSRSSSCFWW